MKFGSVILAVAAAVAATPLAAQKVAPDGTVSVPAFELPFSEYASPEARALLVQLANRPQKVPASDIAARIKEADDENVGRVARLRKLYAVDVVPQMIGGVQTDVVTPTAGRSPRHAHRVLINLHGGGFLWGARSGGLVESVPIAAVGRIKVVTVDYRMAPKHRFPAASEDVAAVYRELLKTYPASNIGIYGCSAGAVLTGQAVAWLASVKLPRPGAIGTFCSSLLEPGGDATYLAAAESGKPVKPGQANLRLPYFAGVDLADPLVFPGRAPQTLKSFPPTLLIAGSRDFAASAVYRSHRLLRQAGVDAELNVWDGMWHSFMSDPEMPESKEVYAVVADFFDRKLGTARQRR